MKVKETTLPHSKQIQSFVTRLLNSRGKLLTAGIGNTSDPIRIKHEKIAKDFDYCKAIYKTDAAWFKFIERHEADIRYILIANKSRAKFECELTMIILAANKIT
jgi:hypothetical protein